MDYFIMPLKRLAYMGMFEFNFLGQNLKGDIKVDTGCGITSIALAGIISNKDLLRQWKLDDIISFKETGKPVITYARGINDRNRIFKDIKDMSVEELLESKYVVFSHTLQEFTVKGMNFGSVEVRVSYDRPGYSLLGMNIIKNYNSYIYSDKYDRSFYRLEDKVNGFLSSEKLKYDKISKCKDQVKFLLGLKKTLCVVEDELSEDYDRDVVKSCIYELVKNQYVEGDLE